MGRHWVWPVWMDWGVCSCVGGGLKLFSPWLDYKILYTQQLQCACAVLSPVTLSSIKLCAVCTVTVQWISAVDVSRLCKCKSKLDVLSLSCESSRLKNIT